MVMMAKDEGKPEEVKKESNILEVFETLVKSSIDDEGVFPYPCIYMGYDGVMNVASIAAVPPMTALDFFQQQISMSKAKEIVLGLDRSTKPGQGTEFNDVLTCYYWKDKSKEEDKANWRKWYRFGVINYQFEPLVVRPLDWKNEFWDGKMSSEIDELLVNIGLVKKDKHA